MTAEQITVAECASRHMGRIQHLQGKFCRAKIGGLTGTRMAASTALLLACQEAQQWASKPCCTAMEGLLLIANKAADEAHAWRTAERAAFDARATENMRAAGGAQ